MMAPEIAVLAAPVTVRTLPARLTAVLLESVSVPASDWTLALAVKVIGPAKVFVPLRLRSAPEEAEPAPASERASEATVMPPCISREAPELTTVPARLVPSALAWPTLRIPALTVVSPSNALLPESVSLPVPDCVRVAEEPVIVPETTVLPAPVKVRALVAATMAEALFSVSVPASDWIVVAPPRVAVPPKVLVPLRLRSAPFEAEPGPVTVRASAPTEIPP